MLRLLGLRPSSWRVSSIEIRFAALEKLAVLAVAWLAAGCCPLFAGTATSTTLAVTAANAPVTTVAAGTAVTLTATVVAGSTPVTTGLVKFCDAAAAHCEDIHILGSAQLTRAGTAVFKCRPAVASHRFNAVFVGTTSYATSASTSSELTVSGPNPSITSIAQSGGPTTYTLTATVAGNLTTTPTGPVSFVDTSNANAVLGTPSLVPAGVNFATVALGAGQAQAITVGDFNGDGIPDLAVAESESLVVVLLGEANGLFSAPIATSTGTNEIPRSMVASDFNGDGVLDLAVLETNGPYPGSVTVLLGNGDGTFTLDSVSPATGDSPVGLVVGDFNQDGIPDLAASDTDGQFSGSVTVLLGNGDGTFSATPVSPSTFNSPRGIAVGDFNGDGIPDLAIANGGSNNVMVLLGNGDGTFNTLGTSVSSAPGDPNSIVVGDFNRDGVPDLAVQSFDSDAVTVLLGNGDGTFTAAASPPAGQGRNSITVGDFNGDGIPDLALPSYDTGTVRILWGNGDGTFTAAVANPAVGTNAYLIVAANLTGDGLSDLFVSTPYGVTMLTAAQTATATLTNVMPDPGTHLVEASYGGDTNYGSSVSATTTLTVPTTTTTLTLTSTASSSQYGQPVTLTATLSPYSAYGQSSNGETVTFHDGSSILGTATLASGVATLTSTTLPGGNNVLTATYAGDADLAPSASSQVPVLVGATTLTLAVSPSSPYLAGQSVTLTATLSPYTSGSQSTNGETITFYSGGVNLGTGTLASGKATLTTTSLPLGSDKLKATYAGDPHLDASASNQITVAVGVTTLTLAVTPASPVVAGQPVTLTATLSPYTSGSNSTNGEPVTFLLPGSGLNLTGTLSGGVATVTTTSIPAGTYNIVASYGGDANLTSATSNAVSGYSIAHAQPTLTLTANPMNSAVGQAVTLTATMSGGDMAAANGETIQFFNINDGANPVGTAPLVSGVATVTASSLPPGLDHLMAFFSSSDAYNSSASSNVVVESVAKAGQAETNVTLAVTSGGAAATSVAVGTAVTLTATVTSSGTPVKSGSIVFCDAYPGAWGCSGLAVLQSVPLSASGTAAITVRLGIGPHTLVAVFSGPLSDAPSASTPSPLTITGLHPTTNYLMSTGQTRIWGTAPIGSPGPGGTEQVIDLSNSNAVLATVQLNPGTYTYWFGSYYKAPNPPATGTKPFGIAAGDFNHDGVPDLAVANSGSNNVSILLGNGDGTYQTQVPYAAGSGSYAVAVGDFNEDGNPDLAVANFSDNTVSILLGNSNGTFQTQQTFATGNAPNSVAVADFNGDGFLDVAVANNSDGTVSILLGKGDGTFQPQQTYATGNGPTSVATADFNNDGNPDLAVTNYTDGTVSVLLGNGDGTFATQVPYATGRNPVSITTGNFDFNGNYYASPNFDLAVANFADNTVSVLIGNGDGTFQSQVPYATGNGPYAVVTGNFEGCGGCGGYDLAVANSTDSTVSILLNQGGSNAVFKPISTSPPATLAGPVSIAAADLNGDGMTDLAVLDNTAAQVTALLNRSGPYNIINTSVDLPGTSQLKVVYSGDSNYAASSSAPFTFTNPPITTTLTLAPSTNLSNYGNSVTLTATLSSAANANVNTDGVTITFQRGSTVLGTGIVASGVATLVTTALPVGIDSLQAKFAGNSDYTASTSSAKSITVRPATLTVMGANVSRAYGAPNPALGGTVQGAVNGDTFTVTGTTTATTASPLGSYPVVPSVSGTDLADYSVTKVNGTLTVTKATPTATVTPASTSVAPTQALSVTVAVMGASGATAPTGTVTLSSGAYTSAATTLSSGSATISIPAGSLAVGADTLSASYSGDSNYNTANATAQVMVANPSYTVAGTAVSVVPGAATANTSTITITPGGGFTGSVAMTASLTSGPSGGTSPPTFSFGATTPVSITAAGSGTATLTINTTAASSPCSSANQMPRGIPWYAGGSAVLAGLFLFGIPKRRRRWRSMLGMLLMLAAFVCGVMACGGGSSAPACTRIATPGTTVGSYTITVTGTSGALTETGVVNLIVQ